MFKDVNECSLQHVHKCTHSCVNSAGSYHCQCPIDMKLADDMKTCLKVQSIYNTPQHDNPSQMSFVKYAQMICADGFILENEKCLGNNIMLSFPGLVKLIINVLIEDIDECEEMTDDCSMEQKCLNTKGSYLCIPTPCPDDYDRDELSGQCIQICSQEPNGICSENAQIAQTISYTILSVKSLNFDVPILKLVNYDISRRPLDITNFSFIEHSTYETFWLEKIPNRMGIVYLFAKETIERTKVYQVNVLGLSYNDTSFGAEFNLLYRTQFIIYVYVA